MCALDFGLTKIGAYFIFLPHLFMVLIFDLLSTTIFLSPLGVWLFLIGSSFDTLDFYIPLSLPRLLYPYFFIIFHYPSLHPSLTIFFISYTYFKLFPRFNLFSVFHIKTPSSKKFIKFYFFLFPMSLSSWPLIKLLSFHLSHFLFFKQFFEHSTYFH